MKHISVKVIVLILTCFLTSNLVAQSSKQIAKLEVNKPLVERTMDPDLQIMKIEVTAQYTRVDFLYRTTNRSNQSMPTEPHTYLLLKTDEGKTYKGLQSSAFKNKWIEINKDYLFSVVYPSIPFDIIKLDIVETEKGKGSYLGVPKNKWNFYGVRMKTEAQVKAEITALTTAANNGDAEAMYELAVKYEKGKGVDKNTSKALELYQKSAAAGSIEAKRVVALAYYDEKITPFNKELAEQYALIAAEYGDARAQLLWGKILEGNDDSNFYNWYLKSAENGNAEAQSKIGFRLSKQGKYEESLNWYIKAAQQGNLAGLFSAGYMYLHAMGTEKNSQKAFSWFQKGAETGDSYSQYWLGYLYNNGEGVQKNQEKAIEWYKKSAQQNHSKALHDLGFIYYRGKNYTEAMKYFQQAAEQKDANSHYVIGYMYKSGRGVLQNPSKAKEYFLTSAEMGSLNGQYELALMYKESNEHKNAFTWFEKSAQQGNSDAQYELGLMYYYAIGVSKNTKKAAEWIEKSYTSGNEDAKKVWNSLELWKVQ